MDCSCIASGENFDIGDAFKSIRRKARREHKCCECGRIIIKGENYQYDSGIWDHQPDSFKTCLDCVSIRNQFFSEGYAYRYMLSDLSQYIWDAAGKIPSACIINLTKPARDKVCDMIQHYWDDSEDE